MLRSYEYTEQSYANDSFQSNLLRDKEINFAYQFSMQKGRKNEKFRKCPVCGKDSGQYFYTKWQVDYLVCESCKSVYACCEKDSVEMYRKYQELLEFRRSNFYQAEVTSRRQQYWEDFLEWLQIRSFRFLKKNSGLSIIDVGNRYYGYIDAIKKSDLCEQYKLIDSILNYSENDEIEQADIVFYFDQMQQEQNPVNKLKELFSMLKHKGMLVIGTRAGSGFDVLTLKEHNIKIYPYEHIVLPSVQGLVGMLEDAGYKVLEVTTPGVMDVQYVREGQKWLDNSNAFVKNLVQADESVLKEFQRFLQKSCMSSYVRVIAMKETIDV